MGRKIRSAAAIWSGLLCIVLWAGAAAGQQPVVLSSPTNQLKPSTFMTNDLDLSALTNEFKIQLWTTTFDLRGTLGYSDNVGLANTNRHGSAFWDTGGDVTGLRLPTANWLFSFFASGDDRRYFAGATGQNEQVVIAGGQASRLFGNGWSAGTGLNYFFQNQITDVQTTETNQAPVSQVTGNNFTGRLFVRRDFKPFWAQLEFSGGRELMSAPLDSEWQFGPRLAGGYRFGHGSEITCNYQWSYALYDTREDVSSAGYELPDTSLRCASQSVDLNWHQAWHGTNWNTYLGGGYDLNQDNGSGYFDCSEYRLSAKIEYRAATWAVAGSVRGAYYDFPIQTIAVGSDARRTKTGVSAAFHVDKKLTKHLKVFVDYTYDDSSSNLAADDYFCNTVSLGFDWRF
jgi:hypothetical protein